MSATKQVSQMGKYKSEGQEAVKNTHVEGRNEESNGVRDVPTE